MLTPDMLDSLARRDTSVVADALIRAQVLGTEVGDRFLATIGNYPERRDALVAELSRRNAWEAAA